MDTRKIIYQIYPLSFKDTTATGTGDIQGIMDKLPYLKDLGINYIWITPIYKSPFKDNGYDIANYYNVDKKFGSNDDLQQLIIQAQKMKINIMLDMVFNHTSIEHEWFKKWINGDDEYQNFYISKTSRGKPPTNWLSKFGGSAWKEYKPDNWYLHLFDETQADLNWENPKVRTKIKEVLRYYIHLGIKGFRFDVINLISKSQYKDDHQGDGRKFYTDGPRVHQYLQELNQEFPKDNAFLTIGELSSTTIEAAIAYTNKAKTELDAFFTFHHLKIDYDGLDKFIDLKPDIEKLNNILAKWCTKVNKVGSMMVNFLNNHDQPRSISRFIDKNYHKVGAKMLFALTSSLPGIPCIFQGEEIGIENGHFTQKEDFRDIESLNYLQKINGDTIPMGLLQKSRDNSRTPMQWDSSPNSGFSHATPWIKVNSNYKDVNVQRAIKDKTSILNFYKEYIDFIKKDQIMNCPNITFYPFHNNIISFNRKYKNQIYKFVFSFNNYNLPYQFITNKIIKTNYNNIQENTLQAYQFIVEEM